MGESISANVLPFDKKAPAFDRRRHDRVPAPDIRARPGGDQLEILDMSQRGMAIKSSRPFSIGGSYLFELLDKGRSLMIEGQVCWSQRAPTLPDQSDIDHRPAFRTGVAFVGIQSRAPGSPVNDLARISIPTEPEPEDERLVTADRIDRLRGSRCPDESAEVLLDLLSADFEHLVLFRIQGDEIRAWLGRGPTLVPDRLLRLRLRLDQASVFLHLQQGGSFFYGTLPAMFAHLQLLQCWNGSLLRECVLFPVRLKDRLVAVLYADAGNQPIAPEHLRSLKAASDLFTQSLIDQILRRKTESSPAPD